MKEKNFNGISQNNVAKYLLIILTPLLILLANFDYLVYNKNFFENVQKSIHSELTIKDRIYYTNNVINYYQGKEILDQKFYSYQAQIHLREVKSLLYATKIIAGLSIILIVSMITIIVHEKMYESIFTAFAYSSAICLLAIGVLGTGLINNFDFIFLQMHSVLFTNTLWLFPLNDTLIQVFPNEFFILFANRLVINTLGTCLFILAISLCGKNYLKSHCYK